VSTFWRPTTSGVTSSSCSPGHAHGPSCAGVLWARCDLCRWSGPMTRFMVAWRGDACSTICDHDWCTGNPQLVAAMEADGWRFV
jgi:hypothetical protein